MEIYPAVDILDGRCVQLVQGRPEAATVYGDPDDWARRWLEEGADGIHIVNLVRTVFTSSTLMERLAVRRKTPT